MFLQPEPFSLHVLIKTPPKNKKKNKEKKHKPTFPQWAGALIGKQVPVVATISSPFFFVGLMQQAFSWCIPITSMQIKKRCQIN